MAWLPPSDWRRLARLTPACQRSARNCFAEQCFGSQFFFFFSFWSPLVNNWRGSQLFPLNHVPCVDVFNAKHPKRSLSNDWPPLVNDRRRTVSEANCFLFSFLAPACQRSYKVKQPGKDGFLNLARIVSAVRCHTMNDSFPSKKSDFANLPFALCLP